MTAERYYVRRPTGKVFGPFDKNAIQLMLKSDKLGFDAQVSKDKQNWQRIADIPEFAAAAPASSGPGGTMMSGWGQGSDLPRPAGPSDLPRPAGGGHMDLPRPSGGSDLPRPAGGMDLPRSAGGGSDLPRPACGMDLPRPQGPPNLPRPSSPPSYSSADEDDLFGGPVSAAQEEDDLFGAPAVTGNSYEEDDLFGAPSAPAGHDDDLFGAPAAQHSDDDDLFGGASNTAAEPSPFQHNSYDAGPSAGGGGGGADDDLFGAPAGGGGTLDADDLFGAPAGAGQEDSFFEDSYAADDDFLGGDQGFSFLDDGPSALSHAANDSEAWGDDLLEHNNSHSNNAPSAGGQGGGSDFLTDNSTPQREPAPAPSLGGGGAAPPRQPAPQPAPVETTGDPFRPASTGIKERAPVEPNKIDKATAQDSDKKRGRMMMFGLPIVAILVVGAVGLGLYKFLGDSGDKPVEVVKEVKKFKLEYKQLFAANNAQMRDIISRSKGTKISLDQEGRLLLAESLMLALHNDKEVIKSADARAKKLASAKSDDAVLGRGALLVAKGDADAGRGLLEPLADKGGEVAFFSHVFLGIADFSKLPERVVIVEEKPEIKPLEPTPVAEPPKEKKKKKRGRKKKKKVEEEVVEVVDMGPPKPKKKDPTQLLVESAKGHFDAAAEVDKALPLYWLGRLNERQEKDDEAVEDYRVAVKAAEEFVPPHVALGRVLYMRGDLNDAIKNLDRVNNDLTAFAHAKEKGEALHYSGAVFSARSDSDKAIDHYTRALSADPNRTDTLRALAEEYERAQKYKEALNFFTTNKTLGDADPNVMLGIVRAHIGLKEWPQAISQLEIGEKKFPTDARFPYYLGELNRRRGAFFDAQKALERAVEIDPTLLAAQAMLAQLAWRTEKDVERGEAHIKEIVAQADQIDARVASEVAEFYKMTGELDLARQWYEAAIKRDPNFWAARLPLSRLLLEQGNTQQALRLLERSRDEGVKDIRLSAYLADAYRQSKLYDRAIDEINKVIERVPDKKPKEKAEYIFIRGRIYFDRGNFDTALKDFNQAYTLNPRYHNAYFYVGRCKLSQGDTPTALKIFRHVLDYMPNNGEFRFFMGIVLEQEDRFTQALDEYRKVTEVDPGYAIRTPRVYITRGRLLSQLGYAKDGRKDIAKALELAPEMTDALIAMGETEFSEKNYEEAIRRFVKALSKEPDHAEAQQKLGMSYVFQNQPRDGVRHLQLAIKHGFKDPDIYRTLGYLYKELGQRPQACAAFEKFLKEGLTAEIPLGTTNEVRGQLNENNCE